MSISGILRYDPKWFTIANEDCSFTKRGHAYDQSSGLCTLDKAISHFFPEASFGQVSGHLGDGEIFKVTRIRLEGRWAKSYVYIEATATQSLELVPQRLTLEKDAKISFGWRYDNFIPDDAKISIKGETSYGTKF